MVSLSNHVAISLKLNTRRQITIATATRLPPPYQVRGRNDRLKRVRVSSLPGLSWRNRSGYDYHILRSRRTARRQFGAFPSAG